MPERTLAMLNEVAKPFLRGGEFVLVNGGRLKVYYPDTRHPARRSPFLTATLRGQRKQAERAWWDLEPRGERNGQRWPKPRPRRGYCTGKNAALAAALMAGPATVKPSANASVQPELFAS